MVLVLGLFLKDNPSMWLVLLLFISVLILGIVENAVLKKRVESVPVRILVNGTRGKSSTARMLVAALNGCGIRTFGKTTGSEARFILPSLSEEEVPRKRGIRMVREHDLMFKKAIEHECKAIVCECMAIREESQKIIGNKLVRPTITVITNARVDHVDQMGDTEEETASMLCLSIGDSSDVFTSDKVVLKTLEGRSCNVHSVSPLPEEYGQYLQKFSFPVHAENLALVLEVCRNLGLEDEAVLEAVVKAVPDPGMTGEIEVDGHLVINGFASNDARSARTLLEGLNMEEVTVIYNNRSDREFRLKMFSDLFGEMKVSDLVVIGDNVNKCRRCFAKILGFENVREGCSGFDVEIGLARRKIVCMGNIKGAGQAFLQYCTDRNTEA